MDIDNTPNRVGRTRAINRFQFSYDILQQSDNFYGKNNAKTQLPLSNDGES